MTLTILASILVLGVLAVRYSGNNVLFVVAAYFFFFAFGPVVSLLHGTGVYFGTRVDYAPQAALGFLFALVGVLMADVLLPQRRSFSMENLVARVHSRGYGRYAAALVMSAAFMLITATLHLQVLLGGSKREKISVMPGHYTVLLLQACLLAGYFATYSSVKLRRLYYANALVYLIYCLLTSERDFLLLILSISVHRLLLSGRVISARTMLAGAALIAFGAFLFTLRSHQAFAATAVLNQGSLLFVDTYVISLVPTTVPFAYGATYLSSFHNVLPFGIGSNGNPTLSQWLVNTYAPGSSTGYGFSLSAEAYLNFGLLAVPVVYGLIAAVQRVLVNRTDRSLGGSYASIFFLFYFLYAVRGESVQLLKAAVYAAVVFAVLFAALPVGRRGGRHPLRLERPALRPQGLAGAESEVDLARVEGCRGSTPSPVAMPTASSGSRRSPGT